ncbi:MAG: Rnase Y domain-containing protein, partial [Candidatus Zixiibacteriota bacterium]
MDSFEVIVLVAIALIVGTVSYLVASHFARRALATQKQTAGKEAERIVAEAEKEAAIHRKEATLEAREEWLKRKSEFDRDSETKRRELDSKQDVVRQQEGALKKKVELLETREKEIVARDKAIHTREKGIELREHDLESIIITQNDKLQKIAQMTPDEAKKQLMDNMVSQATLEAAATIKEIKEKAEQDADKEAKEIILSSIYRCAADHTVESTVSVVSLPSDEMKGRIIGREGRNIRSFETATGIDVIVDDTPEAVIL